MLPRLRPADVARRGVTFGLLGVVPLVVAVLSITGHSDRREFLAVVGGVVGLFGAILLVVVLAFGGPVRGTSDACGTGARSRDRPPQ
jgi:hypothetical protein